MKATPPQPPNNSQQGATVQSGGPAADKGQQLQGVYEAICDYTVQKEDEIR